LSSAERAVGTATQPEIIAVGAGKLARAFDYTRQLSNVDIVFDSVLNEFRSAYSRG